MKQLLLASAALMSMACAASAERYVMITHTMGTDPFWPIVEMGGRDAAEQVGADFEHNFAPSGDMADMARLIESAAATQPDGIIVSLPDPDALGGAVTDATEAGIPVITINAGEEYSEQLGALMHIGQSSKVAGQGAGERLLEEKGEIGRALCLNHEAFNTDLVTRCEGFFDAIGQDLNMIDVSNDVAQITTRTAAALQSDPEVDTLLAVAPHTCEAAATAIDEVGAADVNLVCFDLSAGVIDLIEEGKVDFTIDQQPYLQGYLGVIFLNLYNTRSGMVPPIDVPSGPGFVDQANASAVREQAGTYR
ncbi:sugar ABC transporter substrate-binding protein [Martelella mediterranea]|uniref:sugar ABC transporter substrate-binding protein n=1 Tax=Martelella mediterranea TaxID=293089 RepID=UPI001E312FB2|nr:sugar ABC transporter substrate-binding protein [Martelella mediterranea]MCD1636384.1 sugar ABC transporter substrate-binding protein [Martelella mediterranea]